MLTICDHDIAELVTGLESARTSVGDLPIDIESGYRNPARNDAVGGVSNSRHQWGDAADGRPRDYNGDGAVDSEDRDELADAAGTAGFNEIIKKALCVHMANE